MSGSRIPSASSALPGLRVLGPVAAFALASLLTAAPAFAQDAGVVDPTCTVDSQSLATPGTTCSECDTTSGDTTSGDTSCQTELGSDFSYVCTYSSSVQVWCNGPDPVTASDTTTNAGSCSAAAPSSTAGGMGLMLAVVGFVAAARKRR